MVQCLQISESQCLSLQRTQMWPTAPQRKLVCEELTVNRLQELRVDELLSCWPSEALRGLAAFAFLHLPRVFLMCRQDFSLWYDSCFSEQPLLFGSELN